MVNPYEVMYDSRMDVFRWKEVTVNNITKNIIGTIGTEVPCRYSSSGQTAVEGPAPQVVNSHRLFCGIDTDIMEGDRIELTLHNGKKLELTVGECHPYTYQWQCEVKRKDML